MSVLIIHVGAGNGGVVILQLDVVLQRRFFPLQLCGDGLALCMSDDPQLRLSIGEKPRKLCLGRTSQSLFKTDNDTFDPLEGGVARLEIN